MDDTVSAQALQESEERHRITLLSLSDAVFITTDAGLFTFICPNVDLIFGYSHAEVRAMERIPRLLGGALSNSDVGSRHAPRGARAAARLVKR
jgi:HTH-type transcriptional regulator, bacterioopsin transcriptional activator and related proteins